MKKQNNLKRIFFIRRSHKIIKRKKNKTRIYVPKGKNTKQYRAYGALKRRYAEKLKFWDKERQKFYLEHYAPIRFDGGIKKIIVGKQIGAESDIDFMVEIAEALTSGEYQEVQINLENCTRVWPSGVMLFCSFMHWTRLRSHESRTPPKIASTLSKSDEVTTYLDFCGFHDYVRRPKSNKPHAYSPDKIVKIKREADGEAFLERFDEISKLIKENTNFNGDQFEQFQSMILTEILINVTEHGINYKDMGWYTLTQVHPRSGFISINIADNGIGIKNSLQTGPQKINLGNAKDHHYLEEAFKLNVSGAFSASTKKKGIILKSYEKGQKRGHGFMYIQEACKDLSIQLTLISDKAFIQFDSQGNLTRKGSKNNTIFAGTLYNLTIPCKRVSND